MRARPVPALVAGLVLVAACSSGGDDLVTFCDAITDASLAGAPTRVDLSDGGSVDAAIAELAEVARLAPEEISDEANLVSEIYAEVLVELAAASSGSRDDVLRELQPRLDEAAGPARQMEIYATTTCALEFEGPAAPTPTPTPLAIDD